MRVAVCFLVCAPLLAGCAGPKPGALAGTKPKDPNAKATIVTPSFSAVGKVVRSNQAAGFAVLNFPVGNLPPEGQKWNVYRQGLKVGEVKITGPQQDDNTVADIIVGDAKPGDELRAQ